MKRRKQKGNDRIFFKLCTLTNWWNCTQSNWHSEPRLSVVIFMDFDSSLSKIEQFVKDFWTILIQKWRTFERMLNPIEKSSSWLDSSIMAIENQWKIIENGKKFSSQSRKLFSISISLESKFDWMDSNGNLFLSFYKITKNIFSSETN